MDRVRARATPSLAARVVTRTPLLYDRGADPALDRPAHVRAGSALARLGPEALAVIQDDASFLAILEGAGGALRVRDVPLPAEDGVRLFDDGRGNKRLKLDLEACLAIAGGERLVAFGSGSTPLRDRIVVVDGATSSAPRIRVVEARALYAALRADATFAGAELNVEGAALAGDDVLLLQRGNGAATSTHDAVDATARVDARALLAYLDDPARAPCPPVRDVVTWDLGNVLGTRLTFTDGAPHGAWTAFLACAEASPDATRDGPVNGVSLGRLDDRRRVAEIAALEDEHGAPLTDKAEGLAFDARDPRRAWLVIDRDDPGTPAELLELRLGDGWLP
jgi:hypothetical protein